MSQNLAPAKVLIVDDQPDIQLVTKMSLRRLEWNGLPLDLHLADSGAAAIEYVQQHPDIRVVLMDVVMEHDRAGLDAILKIHEAHPRIQLIVQTGQAALLSEHEVIRAYPIINYLSKGADSSQRVGSMVLLALKNYERLA